jgi:CubicO group peptidase (beta-lactamase class C family)
MTMLKTLLTAVALFGMAATATAQPLSPLPPQPAGQPWPTQAWDVAPMPAAANQNEVARLIGQAMPGPHPQMGQTRAILVVQGGRLVYERYATGFGPTSRFLSWSMAKSVTQALVGAAAARGLLNPDNAMGHPNWRAGDPRSAITWRQWLQMTDGLAHTEIGVQSVAENGAAQMTFGATRRDTIAYVTGLPLAHLPGTRWNYSTAGITLVADSLTHRLAPGAAPEERRARMAAFMREALFDPIGMRSAVGEFDAAGTFQGGSFVWATAQDWARFGYLYLRDGVWDDRRVLPAGWVDFARTPAVGSGADMYGAGFWVTPETGEGSLRRALIASRNPFDAFSAEGRDGQVVLVVPSQDLVIVRLGLLPVNGEATWSALGAWMAALAQCFPAPAETSQIFPLTQGR